ncbi:MAG: hypothetical protein ACPIOQ_38205, partial [Promethearchaeia archaeon]
SRRVRDDGILGHSCACNAIAQTTVLDFDAQNIPKVLDCGPVGNAVSHVHACDRLRSYASLRPSCRGSDIQC